MLWISEGKRVERMKKIGFFKGMDISGLPQYLDNGMKLKDIDGTPMESFAFLKKYGVNSIRLRIWVNPENEPFSGGYCSLEHTLKMAKQIKDNDMSFMLDFHYSDWWADPGKQKKPLAWEGLDRDALETKVYEYTREVLLALEKQGTLPDIVQIGNEKYGIDIKYIDNIVRMQKITRVPKAQEYFNGVINLRGEIVPVMSLRVKFELDADNFTGKTRILILKIEQQAAVGVIVDEVREGVTLDEDSLEKVSYDPNDEKSFYLSGIGKHNDNLISLLNIAGIIVEKEKEA